MSKKIIGATVGTPISPHKLKEELHPVLYTPQALTEAQKAQARANIGVGGTASGEPVAYLYNGAQLPALPSEVEKECPYAMILYTAANVVDSKPLARLWLMSEPCTHVGLTEGVRMSGTCIKYALVYDLATWEKGGGLLGLPEVMSAANTWCYYKTQSGEDIQVTTSVAQITWSNFDMLKSDGTLRLAASEPVPVYSSSGAAVDAVLYTEQDLTEAQKAQARANIGAAAAPEPIAYLYNGVELPPLPDWDKEEYPYACYIENGSYRRLWIFANPSYVYDAGGTRNIAYSTGDCSAVLEGGAWSGFTQHTVDQTQGRISEYTNVKWANFVVLHEDETVCLAASEPVPVYSGGTGGSDGITPHIGSNGNWFIGDNDTGIPATGPSGGQGLPGTPGEDGKDGTSATHSWNGTVLTVTSASGTSSADLKGAKGDQGIQGEKGDTGAQGEPGKDGTNGKDGANGKDGTSATHSWNGTVLTVTSASGTSSADLKGEKGDKGDTGATGPKGDKGDTGDQGIQGEQGPKGDTGPAGADGAKGEKGDKGDQGIQGIQGEKGDTGATGPKGDTGATGPKGDTGADGVSVSSVKQTTTSSADGGSNVVTVTLSDGTTSTFTVKNGSKGSAGTNGTNGKDGKTPVKGVDFWTAADQESIVQDVIAALGTPVFGRVDAENNIILTGALSDGTYTLKYEDADGVITEIGMLNHTVVPEPTWTNVIPLAVNTDGSPYIGTNGENGYKTNTRLNSSIEEVAADRIDTTGYIEATLTDTFYFYNIGMFADSKKYRKIVCYDANFAAIANGNLTIDDLFAKKANEYLSPYLVFSDDGNLVSFNLQASAYYVGTTNKNKIAYIRFVTSTITEDSIITKNETID